jgi:pyruvate formate lyase activating enzyme
MWKFIDPSMTGTVFNIQRFCVNDGPGIRTTVFLKGCPLHCAWCHNPESISPEKELLVRNDRCIRCGSCVEVCEHHAPHQTENGVTTTLEECVQCGRCVEVCYAEARSIVGAEMTTENVLREITKDVVFFDQSGGGATFSGGEPFLQHEYLLSLVQACKENNIHTAVDTSGYTLPEILKRVSPFVDLFLYDIKTIDDGKHRAFTGVSNEVIKKNIKNLIDWGKNTIIRVPLIPGLNDDIQSISGIGKFAASMRMIEEIHILPYHKTGIEKYHRLGKKYIGDFPSSQPPEQIAIMVEELKKYVRKVSIGG